MTSLAETAASATLDTTQIISELQFELQNSVALCASLKSECKSQKQQLLDANAFSTANLKRHAAWKEVWKKERDNMLKREKEVERMKVKLLEDRKELEGSKRKHMLDSALVDSSIRLDHLQDVQAEQARKTERLTQEANKWREQYYDSRKKYEELNEQHIHLKSQIDQDKDVAGALEKEIASLQHAFAGHVESGCGSSTTNSASSEQLARDLRLRLEEKELLLERLHQEVKDIRKGKDVATCLKDELAASHKAEHEKTTLEIAKMNSTQQSLERRIQVAKKELSQAISSKAELEGKWKQSIKELDYLRDAFGEKDDAYKQEVEKLRRFLQQNESQLTKQLSSTKALMVEEQAKTKNLERRCLETQDHAMKQIADLAKSLSGDADDSSDKLLTAQDRIASLENKCSNLKNELNFTTQTHKAEFQRLQHACESCHKDLNLVLLEKNENERIFAAERVKLKDTEERCQSSIHEKTRLSRKIEDLTNEMELLKAKSPSGVEAAEYKEQLSKEQRRSAAYKSKAIEAHKRSLKAKEVLDSLCSLSKQE